MKAKFSFTNPLSRFIDKFSSAVREVNAVGAGHLERCYICGKLESTKYLKSVKIDPLDIYNSKFFFHEGCMKDAILEPEKFDTRQVDRALECQEKLSRELEQKKKREELERRLEEKKRKEKEEQEAIRLAKLEKARKKLLSENT